MSVVLVSGLCPLPFENTAQNFGPGIRSWQFARGLAEAGHDVHLVALAIPGCYQAGQLLECEERDGVRIERVANVELPNPQVVSAAVERHAPEIVVGATIYGSYALAATNPSVPFWADQFGHVMAEAQAKAALDGSNRVLPFFWRMALAVDRVADRISAVSEPQRRALIGELGAVGRLTSETCGYELTAVIPCAAFVPPAAEIRPMLRGRDVPEDAFLAFWSGSFNVWSDVDTLYRALDRAMSANERVHFVSTGGSVAGHDNTTYSRFCDLVGSSPHRDRFYLQGWVRQEDVVSHTAEADLGVLTEHAIYEGELGSKNRVLQWMQSDLPVAYNRVGELGQLLESEELALTFDCGDHEALGERIQWAAEHPEELEELSRRAKEVAESRFSVASTTEPLIRWCESPRRAPDAGRFPAVRSPADFAPGLEPLAHTVDIRSGGLRLLQKIWRWTKRRPRIN